MVYVYLATAIIAEVIATSALKASHEFTRLIPSLVVITGYAVAFYFLTLTIKTLPIGITYAIWSGLGIVLISIIGAIFYKEIPDIPAMIGMALIILGVGVIRVYSNVVV